MTAVTTTDPRIAVIVPVRNDAQRLKLLLESLHQQTLPHQVIVVDNGSTDASREVAANYQATVIEGPGLRVGALRNLGVRSTDSEIIAFCDSDHQVPSDWLSVGVATLRTVEPPSIVGAFCLAPPNGTWVQRVWAIHRLRIHDRGRLDVDWLGAGNMFLRRLDFMRAGEFSEDLIAAEDVDLCHRIRSLGGRIVCDPSIRNVHHGEPRTLAQFTRKEFWRGSSGLKAWFSQGCPWSDVPSLIWPLWHMLVPVLTAAIMLCFAWQSDTIPSFGILVPCMLAWMLPSILLALKIAGGKGPLVVLQLSILYFMYGLARAAALLK